MEWIVWRATTPEFIHEHYHHVFETLIAVLFIVQSRTFSQKLSFLFYILLEHSLTYWAINSSLFRNCVLWLWRLNKTKTADDTNLLISQSLDIDSNYKSIWSMVIKQSNDQSGFISRSHRDYFSIQMFVSTSFNRGNYIQLGLWAYIGILFCITLLLHASSRAVYYGPFREFYEFKGINGRALMTLGFH
jgi:hypothetical protein